MNSGGYGSLHVPVYWLVVVARCRYCLCGRFSDGIYDTVLILKFTNFKANVSKYRNSKAGQPTQDLLIHKERSAMKYNISIPDVILYIFIYARQSRHMLSLPIIILIRRRFT